MNDLNKYVIYFLLLMLASACASSKKEKEPIWQSDVFAIHADRVVQGRYVARAVSRSEIVSDYQSPDNLFKNPRLSFKFSINGKDNEMLPGIDHQINIIAKTGTLVETPLITFGKQFVDDSEIPLETYLAPDVQLKIRLDLRHVLKAFEKEGYFITYDGNRIYKEDFKSVHIAGNSDPLIWDFDNIVNYPELELKDEDQDGIYEAIVTLNSQKHLKTTASAWKLSADIQHFPQYHSNYPLLNALYDMSLEEMEKNVEEDGTFRTGAEWAGVWTRDISYSVILSLAILHPEISRTSLMRKVKNGKIIQDTGTGGAYPVSTDRTVWAVAAWEIYKVTGNRDWLQEAYQIIKNTLEDDLYNAYDRRTGLFKGESSFLDWREQTYPKWMQPADIYESETLGTNTVFYQALVVLTKMATLIEYKEDAEKYAEISKQLKKKINDFFWVKEKGYYGQYLYGRNFKILSPRSEALGEALCVLFDIADNEKQKRVVAATPVTDFGIPCIYPQIPNTPPYHNNGIWPFVQAFWSMAAAKAGNEEALMESLAAIYRPAALFLTNKENMVAGTGDFLGTQVNSDRQLWSVAGSLAMVYKIFFGIDYEENELIFKPSVPEAFQGDHILNNYPYRNATLDIEVRGFGNTISKVVMDGKEVDEARIPAGLEGHHQIIIQLGNRFSGISALNKQPNHFSPATPKVFYEENTLRWEAGNNIEQFKVLKNGKLFEKTSKRHIDIPDEQYGEYQVIAVDSLGHESFASEPVVMGEKGYQIILGAENFARKSELPHKGFTGNGFVEISRMKNPKLYFSIMVPEDGLYALDFRYANGNGPVNTENKCAIRSLKKGEDFLGTVVFPQRGTNEWSNWGFTNSTIVHLGKGAQILTLSFESYNENMNGEVNDALIDYLRITKIQQ